MVIKNKDGSIYRLKEPNPLVVDQEWDLLESDLIFHNFDWASETLADDSTTRPSSNPHVWDEGFEKVKKPEQPVEPVESVEQPVESVEQPAEPEHPVEQPAKQQSNLKNVVVMHCLPAVIRDREDELYGEVYKSIQYGEKFTFEGVVVERNDLYMRFWTNIQLSDGSVIYPSKYRDGVKFGEHRWWRVNQIMEKSGGYLTQVVISDYHPDFS